MSLNDLVRAEISAELGRRRLSETQFAKACGWKQMYLWRRLSGQTPLTIDDLDVIAHALDTSAAALLTESIRQASRGEDQPGRISTHNLSQTDQPGSSRTNTRPATNRRADRRTGEGVSRPGTTRQAEAIRRPVHAHPGDGVRRPRAIGALAAAIRGDAPGAASWE